METVEKWSCVAMLILTVIAGILGHARAADYVMVTKEIEIERGDTIYNTVARTVNNKNNINEVVARAIRENDITDVGNVEPGTKLKITYKE